MNLLSTGAMIILVCAVILVMMAVLGPCLVQNLTNVALGSDTRAGDNIAESLDNLNEALEDASQVDEWLESLDEVNQ